MRMYILSIALIIIIGCGSINRTSQPNKFYIIFGSCFKSTKIDLKIGEKFKIDNLLLESDFSTGVVLDKSITYDGTNLKFISKNELSFSEPFRLSQNNFILYVKDSIGALEFDVNLNKGRYIFIEYCDPSRSLEMKQYKRKPIVE